MDSKLRPETLCIQAGYTPKNGEPRQIPIVQSTTFKYDTSEDMGKLFDLEAEGYFYSRLANPTCDAVAAKICALEGGTCLLYTSRRGKIRLRCSKYHINQPFLHSERRFFCSWDSTFR